MSGRFFFVLIYNHPSGIQPQLTANLLWAGVMYLNALLVSASTPGPFLVNQELGIIDLTFLGSTASSDKNAARILRRILIRFISSSPSRF